MPKSGNFSPAFLGSLTPATTLPITIFSKPDFNISSISYNFLEKAQEYHDKIKTIIEQEYPNSVIPVFFRNFTKCAKVYSLL